MCGLFNLSTPSPLLFMCFVCLPNQQVSACLCVSALVRMTTSMCVCVCVCVLCVCLHCVCVCQHMHVFEHFLPTDPRKRDARKL